MGTSEEIPHLWLQWKPSRENLPPGEQYISSLGENHESLDMKAIIEPP